MRFVRNGLGIGAITGLIIVAGAGASFAQCGHVETTAQSQKPTQVAQTMIPSTTPQSDSAQAETDQVQQE